MRSIAYITPTFWTRGSGKKLRGNSDAIALIFYLMTAPQSSYLGLYYSSLVQIAHDLGWTVEKVKATFPAISEMARYDEEAELVWVPATLRHQIGDEMGTGDKRRVNIDRELKLIGQHEFVNEFRELYGDSHGVSSPGSGSSKETRVPTGGEKTKKEEGGREGASGTSPQVRKGHPDKSKGDGRGSTRSRTNPPPSPTHNLESAENLSAGSGGAKIPAAEFNPGPEHVRAAQELELSEESFASALSAYREKVKKSRHYTEHSKSFLNFLRSEARGPSESSGKEDDESDERGKPAALFWYELHLSRGELEEAEKYRLKCVKLGILKGEN